MAHAEKAPSGANTWMACPASIPMQRGRPDNDTLDAATGTVAHYLAYLALNSNTDLNKFVGTPIREGDFEVFVDDEFVSYVYAYVNYVRSQTGPGEMLELEQKLPIGHFTMEEGAHGTTDALIVGDERLKIIDLKFGIGNPVDAVENKQLMIYALACYDAFQFYGDFKEVELHIVQPRLHSITSWATTIEHLEAFRTQVIEAAAAVEAAEAELQEWHFAPGEKQCQWCKAKGVCKALAESCLATATDDAVDLRQPINITDWQMDDATLGRCVAATPLIEQWLKAIDAEAERKLMDGGVVPGAKLVMGRMGNRKWADDEKAEAKLKRIFGAANAVKKTVITPAQAEKLAKKDPNVDWDSSFAPMTWQPPGKPQVAPESDKRPAYIPEASLFDDVSGDK